MNSRWQASKIGLVNFWYYDEQEFSFVKGRMLLRGSNGSGKSVTMQSVVPLLLDGNMSPERLDPFGSRDRKMSSYLLEEDDEREERTGYLYLEFKRQDSETYMTIGMGIRARKGKPLDKWYFSLTDGRRIGKDFFLYKETDEKVTLTKRELENRLAEGGEVFDRQADYMEYVNRQIFGFDTVDEYREMIDLLIQLRTPKLSKDFKPSVINEILSDSLQPLSDDDLRPMSEAIENMDAMSMNLKARQEAKQAADKIAQVLDKYNRFMLYEKAQCLEKEKSRLLKIQVQSKEKRQSREMCEQEVKTLSEELVQMDAMRESMEKEKETLSKSDAVSLKSRELALTKEAAEHKEALKKKNSALASKEEQYLDLKRRKKIEEDRSYEKETQLTELLEDMQTQADDMAFEEHAFLRDELTAHLGEPYSFSMHRQQFDDVRARIRKGTQMLREMSVLERQKDELLKKRERHEREQDASQRKQTELEVLLVQLQNEWKEALYSWNGKNEELILQPRVLHEFCAFADAYRENPDFSVIQRKTADVWIESKSCLESRNNELSRELKEINEKRKEVQAELTEWENHREPEPERSEEVRKNRQRLDEKQIPYEEFYKLVEFCSSLDEAACGCLEEALLQMGILDALVIDEQYKEEVLAMDEGCCDRYLFASGRRSEKSLLDVLELGESADDIFKNQRLNAILGSIAYEEESETALVSPRGVYCIGPVTGTITKTHTAEFIGTKARMKNRQRKIEECRARLEELQQQKTLLEEQMAILSKRKEKLSEEYSLLPDDHDMKEALRMLREAVLECERLQKEAFRLEEERKKLAAVFNEKKKEAIELAKGLYLDCTLTVFEQAEEAAGEYAGKLQRVIPLHELYLQSIQHIKALEEDLERSDEDLDDIRYDIEKEDRAIRRISQELDSVKEQLQLTDYEQIKERLDECLAWLNSYPDRLQQCVQKKTQKQQRVQLLEQQIKEDEAQIGECSRIVLRLETFFEAEKGLGYVELSSDSAQIVSLLSSSGKVNKEDLIGSLNTVIFENKAYLTDYQFEQTSIFEELDDDADLLPIRAKRMDFFVRYQGTRIPFVKLPGYLEQEIEIQQGLIRSGDRELFEDILANTVSRKIRAKINSSNAWVAKMNQLMNAMNTSSGLKLSLRWRSKTAEKEEQLDTKELVELLKRDSHLLSPRDLEKLSSHFRSKVEEARRSARDSGGMVSFYQVMKDTLDYRKWFEFQLFSQKSNERQKELTNSVFGTFSGGEKAMSMYVPLFSAVVAKYQGGRADAPRLISLDEAFAGVDNRNIRDMFRLMTEFEFDFIINSQVLWGDCDTLDALAIYQLIRPQNAKFVTVMPYLWNGHSKALLENEEEVAQEGAKLEHSTT